MLSMRGKQMSKVPEWVELGVVVGIIISVMVVGYYLGHPDKHQTIGHPITNESIDQNANKGILPVAYGFSDIIPAHPPFTIVQNHDKTLAVLLKLYIGPNGRMTVHCDFESCNIRNATNYIYDELIDSNYMDNQTVKIMVNNQYQVFNGTVYDLRG